MNNKLLSFCGCIIWALLMICPFTIVAQSNKTDDPKQKTRLYKVIKSDGWEIPQFSESDFKDTDTITYLGVSTTRKLYVLQNYYDTELEHYYLDSDNNLYFRKEDYSTKTLMCYSSNGKIFMYSIPYILWNSKKPGVPVGIKIDMYYIDEDGDGKFETRYEYPGKLDKIPDWVLKSNK